MSLVTRRPKIDDLDDRTLKTSERSVNRIFIDLSQDKILLQEDVLGFQVAVDKPSLVEQA